MVRWSMLRTIGRSRLAQATIFIPIIGYLFIFNNEFTSYLNLLPIFGNGASSKEFGDLNLSRLICIYIGLSCIGIGSIIFTIVCPSEISDNADEHEFNLKEMDIMTPFRFELMRRKLSDLRPLGSVVLQAEVDRLMDVELSDSIGALGMRTPELQSRGLLWTDWLNKNKSNLSSIISVEYQLLDLSLGDARSAITVLYAIGVGFLLLPSTQVFFKAIFLLRTVGQYLFHL